MVSEGSGATGKQASLSWFEPSCLSALMNVLNRVCFSSDRLFQSRLNQHGLALCANIAETTGSSLITVEGEEKTDVKRYEKQRSPRS